MTMEYLSGGTLADRLGREGNLEPEEAAGIALRIAAALGEVHRRGVIHRDIKPENVFLAPEGEVKIGDFGIARAADATAMIGRASFWAP